MGLISSLLGSPQAVRSVGETVQGVAEVFHANETREMELSAETRQAALSAHMGEFRHARRGWFDRFVNGLNRMPRPMLALGTLGLFVYAMVDPTGFAPRMEGLALVPEPLWWLLGAIVSFYFGARELHHFRNPAPPNAPRMDRADILEDLRGQGDDAPADENPALEAWLERQRESERGE